jgi:phosphatidate phosphatase PAH1
MTDKTVSVHITVSPSDPNLSLFAQGSLSSFEVQLADTSEAFFKFECAEETTQSFNMAFVKATLPALTASKEVRLRINTYGMLSLVAVITTDDEQVRTYVEYIIAPEDAGTGDGEDEGEENYGFGGNDAEDNQ